MNFFIINDTVPHEGLKQSPVFFNTTETKKSHHKIDAKMNMPQERS